MSLLLVIIEAFFSIVVPGVLLSLALLKKTKLPMFEIVVIGFILGLIFPPVMVWLYNINVVLLTILCIILCFQQKVFTKNQIKKLLGPESSESEARQKYIASSKESIALLRNELSEIGIGLELTKKHEAEEKELLKVHKEKKEAGMPIVWTILLLLMALSFVTRIVNIGVAPNYFEFDPYYDMISAQYILTYGYQLLYDHSAWPTLANGTIHRIQPIVPYLEAYWYDLANTHAASATSVDTTLLSLVSSYYPPIMAALLVFVVFMLLYHEYGRFPALVGASIAASMPALITTFIAGEQLLEPWGIFAMFFFYAAYLLAVNNTKEKRFAVLAGIAYASTFLGAHYYTVTAGVLAIYIVLQGIIHVLKNEDMREFYKVNAIVIVVFTIFYLLYMPYSATLTERIPNVIGIPVIIAFPLFALIFAFVLEYLSRRYSKLIEGNKVAIAIASIISIIGIFVIAVEVLLGRFNKDIKALSRFSVASVLGFIILLLILLTPLGKPVDKYVALSTHFITPSIPLFMTVQEYEPTGINFNFGSAGFGIIGLSIGGVNILLWLVLALFTAFELAAIYYRNSRISILMLAAVWPLAIAGMVEVKYLPHFGVGYILAIGVIIGELIMFVKNGYSFNPKKSEPYNKQALNGIYAISIFVILLEATSLISVFSAAMNQNCNAIISSNNAIGYDLFCNQVPNYWLSATKWMRANVGPFGPRILSWWDYGDWINWFGNSNAVLRGDNAVATLDYATAAQYVLGPADGFGAGEIANFMNNIVQAKYLLLDDQIMPKWGALDFLACIDVNETSMQYAEAQGAAENPPQPYALGTSSCELNHDPVFALVPLNVTSISSYCQFSNSTVAAVKLLLLTGNQQYVNGTYCLPTSFYNSTKPVNLYNSKGVKIANAFIIPNGEFYYGPVKIYGQEFLDFMVVYTPNGPNETITNAPSEFYSSNYYRGFFFGKLPGFSLVYPKNFTGINYINSTNPIMILQLNNYSGKLPYVTPKPSWVKNNYTMPG